MASTSVNVPVDGTVTCSSEGPLLVLSRRLDDHDTFLSGSLEVGEAVVPVRILTLDNVTVLRPMNGSPVEGARWHGTLRLPHGLRPRSVPPDLRRAAEHEDRSLEALDEAELRYALTFLSEATTNAIRQARVRAIVCALPTTTRSSS